MYGQRTGFLAIDSTDKRLSEPDTHDRSREAQINEERASQEGTVPFSQQQGGESTRTRWQEIFYGRNRRANTVVMHRANPLELSSEKVNPSKGGGTKATGPDGWLAC
jgi:hypothetical protein